jgi:two-component system, NtrC family, sensor kinase
MDQMELRSSKAISPLVQRFFADKWQYIYYILAAFNILTISASLYFNYRIMGIYTHSIVVNRQWATRLQTYSELGQLLTAMNAPGNNVFDSHNVEFELGQLAAAQANFDQKVNTIQQEIEAQVELPQRAALLKDLQAVNVATRDMTDEAKLIFAYFRQKQAYLAGKRMATMDQKYGEVTQSLATFLQNISQIQSDLLEQQEGSASAFQHYQVAIVGAMLLMVGGITAYGHQLAQKIKLDAQAKERSIAELQDAETVLQEQAQALQLTLANLQNTQLQLFQSEKMSSLGQMVAGIAHEINNPVNFIHANLEHVRQYAHDLLNFVQMARQSCTDVMPELQQQAETIDLEFIEDDLLKILNSMYVGTDRIRSIVLSLRSFSRLDEAELKVVDIHEGIESTLLILQHRCKSVLPNSGIEVIKDYGDLPKLECYVGQLNQVFMNILTNSIDALEGNRDEPEPGRKHQITIHTSTIDSNWVKIAIADNGIGIPEAIQQKIFEPFFTTKPVGKGTGLGMSISYKIIQENHQGQLKCFSTPGQGTEFVIEIPIRLTHSLGKISEPQSALV